MIGNPLFRLCAAAVAAGAILSASATAQTDRDALGPAIDPNSEAEQRYASCVKATGRTPDEALAFARDWRNNGGDIPARHCLALALVALERYENAAAELEEIAHEIWLLRPDTHVIFDAPMRADILGQAGNAWMLAGYPGKALNAFDEAIGTLPPADEMRPEFLIDRARANAELGRFEEALADLDDAKMLSNPRSDVHTFRASALIALKRYEEAAAELETALVMNPRNVYALLERGRLRKVQGDLDGAKSDFEAVLEIERYTPVADAAAANLAEIEGTGDGDS